jgi:hypothetical protein
MVDKESKMLKNAIANQDREIKALKYDIARMS